MRIRGSKVVSLTSMLIVLYDGRKFFLLKLTYLDGDVLFIRGEENEIKTIMDTTENYISEHKILSAKRIIRNFLCAKRLVSLGSVGEYDETRTIFLKNNFFKGLIEKWIL